MLFRPMRLRLFGLWPDRAAPMLLLCIFGGTGCRARRLGRFSKVETIPLSHQSLTAMLRVYAHCLMSAQSDLAERQSKAGSYRTKTASSYFT